MTKIDHEGKPLFRDISFTLRKGDKVAFLARDHQAVTALLRTLMNDEAADSGEFKWGTTITCSYLPNDNTAFFQSDLNLVDWLRQYSKDKDETYVRGFLGRMLFTGEETRKV